MKLYKSLLTGLALGTTLIGNVAPVMASQNLDRPTDTGETNVEITVDPTYTVTIPMEISENVPYSLTGGERELAEFEVSASDVVIPHNHALEVSVQANSDYRNGNQNAAVNELGAYLDFYFARDTGANYGFEDGFNEGDVDGSWVVAQFRPVTDALHTDSAAVSMLTDQVLATSGTYNSSLVFDIELVEVN